MNGKEFLSFFNFCFLGFLEGLNLTQDRLPSMFIKSLAVERCIKIFSHCKNPKVAKLDHERHS